jgi:hypothetical protein
MKRTISRKTVTDVTALAQSVRIGQTTYAVGTDHAAMPAAVVDAIRNPNAWVGGVAPALSAPAPAGKPQIIPADLTTPEKARAALGLPEFDSGHRVVLASGDVSGVKDTAAIQAAEDALSTAGGGTLVLAAGSYWVKSAGSASLTKRSNVTWQGAGRGVTVVKQAAGANQPIVSSVNFSGLTLTGSNTAGLTGCAIRDMTFDGNASNQTVAAAAAVRIFGFDYVLAGISLRNCKAVDGLYTEWGTFGGPGLPESGMESTYQQLRLHSNVLTGAAWRHRGPHDSIATDIIIHGNNGAVGFHAETTGFTYTVAAGSNGVNVSTFAGAGTLSVNTVVGLPSSGTVQVATGSGARSLTYAGTSGGNQLTGVTATGSGVLSTGGAITAPSYAGSATLVSGMHVWGNHTWSAIADANTKFVNSELEGGTVGQLLVRGGDVSWTGGRIFYLPGTSNPGMGIQLGDTSQTCNGFMLNDPDMTGFAGTSAATAAINVVATASGQYRAHIFQPTGRAIWGNALQAYEARDFTYAGGTHTPSVAASAGLGSSPPAPTMANASDRRGSVRLGSGTSPTSGSAVAVTWGQQKPGTPTVTISPGNAATAALQPYAINATSTGLTIGFAVAPAASQAASTYEVLYRVEG